MTAEHARKLVKDHENATVLNRIEYAHSLIEREARAGLRHVFIHNCFGVMLEMKHNLEAAGFVVQIKDLGLLVRW
jgi:hypothetical protein